MLELGVDEISITLQVSQALTYGLSARWETSAEIIIDTYSSKAQLETYFGCKMPEPTAPKGYAVAYHFGSHSWYFALAYHPEHPQMGVIARWSAQALDYYLEKSKLKLYQLLHITTDKIYTSRLSRIDLTADYIDENIDVTTIYHGLINREIGVYERFEGPSPDKPIYKKRNLQIRGFCIEDEVPTVYIGSPSSNAQARIYDKRREQLERKSSKFHKALNCKNWVRFELVLRHEYAHQMSDYLSRIYTDIAFANLIASVILQKLRFMKMKNGVVDIETDYSQMLVDCINNNSYVLKSSVTKNYDLAKNIEYLYKGSGIMQTLYKIETIWGTNATEELLQYLLNSLDKFEPSKDCSYWLFRNSKDFSNKYPTFQDFIDNNLRDIIADEKFIKNKHEK